MQNLGSYGGYWCFKSLIGKWEIRKEGKPYVIYYASKLLDDAQINYTTTEKELFAIVYVFDKFRQKVIVYSDHAALKYLQSKKDAKT